MNLIDGVKQDCQEVTEDLTRLVKVLWDGDHVRDKIGWTDSYEYYGYPKRERGIHSNRIGDLIKKGITIKTENGMIPLEDYLNNKLGAYELTSHKIKQNEIVLVFNGPFLDYSSIIGEYNLKGILPEKAFEEAKKRVPPPWRVVEDKPLRKRHKPDLGKLVPALVEGIPPIFLRVVASKQFDFSQQHHKYTLEHFRSY